MLLNFFKQNFLIIFVSDIQLKSSASSLHKYLGSNNDKELIFNETSLGNVNNVLINIPINIFSLRISK